MAGVRVEFGRVRVMWVGRGKSEGGQSRGMISGSLRVVWVE